MDFLLCPAHPECYSEYVDKQGETVQIVSYCPWLVKLCTDNTNGKGGSELKQLATSSYVTSLSFNVIHACYQPSHSSSVLTTNLDM